MHWRDLKEERPEGQWLGLELFVEIGDAPQRPAFHMQAAVRGFLRLMVRSSPLLWARIDRDHCGYTYLRSDRAFSVLDPLTAPVARAAEAAMSSPGFRAYWAREFAARLMASPVSPLHPGRWWLLPGRGGGGESGWQKTYPQGHPLMLPPASLLTALPSQPSLDSSQWSHHDDLPPLALRPLSPADDGRVKAWRRSFREQTLPPVLMLWTSGLQRLVILDGHDRLAAALAEGGVPEVMILSLVNESALPPVEGANQLLNDAFDGRPRLSLGSRGWPLSGGVDRWLEEVQRHVPDDAEAALSEALLAPV
jgi:hypothetical protein